MTPPGYYTREEAAKALRKCPRTISRWVRRKLIQANKIANTYFIPCSEVERILKVKGGF